MKNVKLAGEVCCVGQETKKGFFFFKYLINVIQEKGYWKNRFSILLRLAYFIRTEQTYKEQVEFQLTRFSQAYNLLFSLGTIGQYLVI